MSALAVPFLFTNDALIVGQAQPVNAEHLATLEVGTKQSGGINSTATDFIITFIFARTDVHPKSVVWDYGSTAGAEAARDADFAAILVLIAATV